MPRRSTLAIAALVLAAAPARADDVTAESMPSDDGVLVVARTVIDAPAARVAAIVGDPSSFAELFPAEEVRVLGDSGGARIVALRMRDRWVGAFTWIESLARSTDGAALVVERRSLSSEFYAHLHAIWRVTPLSAARCEVTYRVDIALKHWPTWMIRRGTVAGVAAVVGRLRTMSARATGR